eukprot:403373497
MWILGFAAIKLCKVIRITREYLLSIWLAKTFRKSEKKSIALPWGVTLKFKSSNRHIETEKNVSHTIQWKKQSHQSKPTSPLQTKSKHKIYGPYSCKESYILTLNSLLLNISQSLFPLFLIQS